MTFLPDEKHLEKPPHFPSFTTIHQENHQECVKYHRILLEFNYNIWCFFTLLFKKEDLFYG
ncbi:hypothetical protein FXB70_04705 [Aggregatibacter actinomycetemcomitans]|nr:hypothetical protein ANH9381_0189 [Aggregatibacter actinomycetemcomitans ANH9381]TQE41472.1 hypothetical protein SC1000_04250 [Aggregatibacter actinomycetemcomitans]TYA16442.1 hypothetical protein FXE10_03025 [Aggregatibacter actinomycetemcomitans]TYA23724.1 hypothetical protein FXB91_02130 [Aggregatibacter actinomycetemcomitans]TYA25222.1 hypothetical protein FXE05_06260 [Aggregatibacter actinomycetemcomitans]